MTLGSNNIQEMRGWLGYTDILTAVQSTKKFSMDTTPSFPLNPHSAREDLISLRLLYLVCFQINLTNWTEAPHSIMVLQASSPEPT